MYTYIHTHTYTQDGTGGSSGEIAKDFYYVDAGAQGGTQGVLWALLNDDGFTAPQKASLNYTLMGSIGAPTNFFSFKAIVTMVKVAVDERAPPVSFDATIGAGGPWLLADGNTFQGTQPPALVGKNLAIYIPATGLYCTFLFTAWGDGGGGELGYERVCT